MNVTGTTHVSAQINPATESHRAHHLPARQLTGLLVLLRRAQEAREDQDPHDRLIPGSQRGTFTRRGERGGADDLEFREGLLRVRVDAAQDEEVGGDAGVGRVVPVERRHTQVKPHLLPQKGDVGGHQSDEEPAPRRSSEARPPERDDRA